MGFLYLHGFVLEQICGILYTGWKNWSWRTLTGRRIVKANPVSDRLIIILTGIWAYIWYFRIVCMYRRRVGAWPNPAFPTKLDEKFLWRKIFDRNPEFTCVSDKLESQYIARQRCPEIQIPRTLWTGMSALDIPKEILKGNVVVKATHGSGYVFPVFDGEYDIAALERSAKTWLRQTFGRRHWEWGYFGVKPRLLVEEMILDETGGYHTTEVKLYVYCGQISMIVLIRDRLTQSSAIVLHGDWSPSVDTNKIGAAVFDGPLPENRAQIEDVARRLCTGFDHMRCDLYLVGDDIYFGEYTVYNQGGYVLIERDEVLRSAHNQAWDVSRSWFLTTPQRGWSGLYAASLLRQLQN